MIISFSVEQQPVIKIEGTFCYQSHWAFKATVDELFEKHSDLTSKITVDMAETTSIDSAALGMLLMLRARCKPEGAEQYKGITLKVQTSSNAHQMLEAARFENLFNIVGLN